MPYLSEDLHLTKPLMGIVMLLLVLKFYTSRTLSFVCYLLNFNVTHPSFSFKWNKERLISMVENVMQDAHFLQLSATSM